MTGKHIQINGFRAEVLDDGYSFVMRESGSLRQKVLSASRIDRPSTKEIDSAIAQAESEGFDVVEVTRHTYAKYDLRYTMSARSGWRVITTNHTRRNGQWIKSTATRQSFY